MPSMTQLATGFLGGDWGTPLLIINCALGLCVIGGLAVFIINGVTMVRRKDVAWAGVFTRVVWSCLTGLPLLLLAFVMHPNAPNEINWPLLIGGSLVLLSAAGVVTRAVLRSGQRQPRKHSGTG